MVVRCVAFERATGYLRGLWGNSWRRVGWVVGVGVRGEYCGALRVNGRLEVGYVSGLVVKGKVRWVDGS